MQPSGLASLLDSNGSSALVQADALGVETVTLTASNTDLGISEDAQILFAELAAGTVYIPSSLVIDPGHGNLTVVLRRTPTTEALAPGNVLISGSQAGLLVRILTVDLTTGEVILTVEPASINEALYNADIQSSSPQERIDVQYRAAPARIVVSRNGEIIKNIVPTIDLECKYEDGSNVGLDVVGGSIDWAINHNIDATLHIVTGTVQEFSVTGNQSLGLSATTGSLNFSSELTGTAFCVLSLGGLSTPAYPLYVFSFGLSLNPKLGVAVGGSFSGPSFTINGPTANMGGVSSQGIRYMAGTGWEAVGSAGWDGNVNPPTATFNRNTEFALAAAVFGSIGLALDANLGVPPFGFRLAAVEFAELKASATLTAVFTSPFEPNDRNYSGPSWDAKARLRRNTRQSYQVEH